MLFFLQLADAYAIVNDIDQAYDLVDSALRQFPDDSNLLYYKFFLLLAKTKTAEAIRVSQEIQKKPQGERPDANDLYIAALAQLLTGEGDWEYTSRSFLVTDHEYRDYIRMILYWALKTRGRDKEADELLGERWKAIDKNKNSWDARLRNGDTSVWQEISSVIIAETPWQKNTFGPR